MPWFSEMLPDEHQSRDFLNRQEWWGIDAAVKTYIVKRLWQKSPGRKGADDNFCAPPNEHIYGPNSDTTCTVGCFDAAAQLTERGWTVMVGAAAIAPVPPGAGPAQNAVDAILKDALSRWPGEARMQELAGQRGAAAEDPSGWSPIYNRGNSRAAVLERRAGQGRMTVRSEVVRSSDDDRAQALYKAKLIVDLVATAVAYHVVRGVTCMAGRPWERVVVRAPKMGSRFLLTTDKAMRQAPHVDFNLMVAGDAPKKESAGAADDQEEGPAAGMRRSSPAGGAGEPSNAPGDDDDIQFVSHVKYEMPPARSYFVMGSGADGFVLVVWPGSVLAARRIEEGDKSKRVILPEIVVVPPNSFVILRADLVHAGAGADDDQVRLRTMAPSEISYKRSIRTHMYLTHPDHAILDRVYLVDRSIFVTDKDPDVGASGKKRAPGVAQGPGTAAGGKASAAQPARIGSASSGDESGASASADERSGEEGVLPGGD